MHTQKRTARSRTRISATIRSNLRQIRVTTSIHSKRCWISNGQKLLATATMTGNLYKLDLHSDSETTLLANTAELWHLCLAHIQPSTITEMAKSKAVQGLEISSSNKIDKTCSSCVLGKAHRTLFRSLHSLTLRNFCS